MKSHSDHENLRDSIIGLGTKSYKKSYYPLLQNKIKELENAEHNFHTIFNSVNESIFVHNIFNGSILNVNQSACNLFQYNYHEMLKLSIENLSSDTSPYTQADALGWFKKSIAGKIQIFEWKSKKKDGTNFWTEVNMQAVTIGDEKVILVSIHDIDEKKRNQLELNQYKEHLEEKVAEQTRSLSDKNNQLELTLQQLKETQGKLIQNEKMATLGLLLAGVAHEINNPVNYMTSSIPGLESNISLLLKTLSLLKIKQQRILTKDEDENLQLHLYEIESDQVEQEIFQLLENINRGALRTTDILKSLHFYSRSDNEQLSLFNIEEPIEQALILLKNRIDNTLILDKQFGAHNNCYGSMGKINQVIVNLFVNALHAIDLRLSPKSGKISIITQDTMLRQRPALTLIIENNGPKISDDMIHTIFDPFFTTKRAGKGSGLGLSICQQIVVQHKGEIKVTSDDKKTSFSVILPSEKIEVKSNE